MVRTQLALVLISLEIATATAATEGSSKSKPEVDLACANAVKIVVGQEAHPQKDTTPLSRALAPFESEQARLERIGVSEWLLKNRAQEVDSQHYRLLKEFALGNISRDDQALQPYQSVIRNSTDSSQIVLQMQLDNQHHQLDLFVSDERVAPELRPDQMYASRPSLAENLKNFFRI